MSFSWFFVYYFTMIKITQCLLDVHNPMPFAETNIGHAINALGKEHLWSDRSSVAIDTIVIHSISAINIADRRPHDLPTILSLFCKYGVSAHYLVLRNGEILQLVPEEYKAWHAGGSIMPSADARTNVNEFSIGIELVAAPDVPFTKKQYLSLSRLFKDAQRRYGREFSYVGHNEIAGEKAVALGLRTDVKTDPGDLFDWDYFFLLI